MMVDARILSWFRLINSKGIGVKAFWTLMNYYHSAEEAIKHVDHAFPEDEALDILSKINCDILLADDDRFPKLLVKPCPPILYCRGNIDLLKRQKLAIVGARNASLAGKTIAYKLAENLSNDIVIMSGMARGIDTSALNGALKSSQAIAVLPFGFNNIYPKENINLFNKIAENGLVITEIPPNRTPEQGMFQMRNKLIVLMSKGIVVIEAALKSGTMTTANLALDFGKEVMVVPGSPLDSRSFGSNTLIKNGANLVQSAQDVLDIIGYISSSNALHKKPLLLNINQACENSNILQSKILSNLSDIPTTIDDLHVATNIPISQLLSTISLLEISGKIGKTPQNELILV